MRLADLRDYLKTFDAKPLHPVTPLASGGEFTGKIPSRIYNASGALNGDAHIVVEAAPQGLIVNLFPVVSPP